MAALKMLKTDNMEIQTFTTTVSYQWTPSVTAASGAVMVGVGVDVVLVLFGKYGESSCRPPLGAL